MLFAFTCLVLGKVRLVATWLTVKRGGHLSDKPLRQKRSAATDVTASLINWVYVLQSNNILTYSRPRPIAPSPPPSCSCPHMRARLCSP
ncbi:hypothetical protein EDB81DRAFT_807211 [Dactylonectria macrodidyma]|uniref:Secreted protein n=1 Tax=Dactylonectria macrodidyma TaxID=307937 RepID=A0A9P9EAG3_9HYPO|nr:hypothetical protein EDB81DRAFT_807211 [Dactylonectria macrodidyma]